MEAEFLSCHQEAGTKGRLEADSLEGLSELPAHPQRTLPELPSPTLPSRKLSPPVLGGPPPSSYPTPRRLTWVLGPGTPQPLFNDATDRGSVWV